MKKLSIIVFALFLSICLFGCSDEEGALDYINYPTGLEINGEVLSWDEVEGAKGYIVYANDEEVEDTKDLSFDFSEMSESQIIFRVQAKGPRGYEDSGLSASVGYLDNAEDELDDMIEFSDENYLNLEEEFFEELIRKGMTAQEFEDMYVALDWIIDGDHDDDLSNLLDDFKEYLDDLENLEAFVSATVAYLMPSMLDSNIEMMEGSLDYFYEVLEEDPDDPQIEIVEDFIDQYEKSIEVYEGLNDEIKDNPDTIVLAITNGIEYLFSIAEMTSSTITDTLNDVVNSVDPEDVSASEMALMIDEMVLVLEETMPSQEDFMVIFTAFEAVNNVVADAYDYEDSVESLNSKLAVQTRYSIQAFINLLGTFDEAFFTSLFASAELEDVYQGQYEALSLLVEYFDIYYDDNQDLFDDMDDVFTLAEKEILYNQSDFSFMFNMNYYYGYSMMTTMMSGLSFEGLPFDDFINLTQSLRNTVDVLLDEVSENSEIIEQILILNNFHSMSNYYLDEVYDTYDQYYWNKNYQTIVLFDQILDLTVSVNDEVSDEEFISIYSFLTNYINSSISPNLSYYDIDLTALFDVLDMFGEDNDSDLHTLYNELFEHFQEENTFGEIATVCEDFLDSNDEDLSSVIIYGMVFLSIDDYLTTSRMGTIEDLVDDFLEEISNSDLEAEFNLTDSDIADFDEAITAIFDTLALASESFGDVDFSDLSESDMDLIFDYMEDLGETLENFSDLINELDL